MVALSNGLLISLFFHRVGSIRVDRVEQLKMKLNKFHPNSMDYPELDVLVSHLTQPKIASAGMTLHSGRPMTSRERRARAQQTTAQHKPSNVTMSLPDSTRGDSSFSQGGSQIRSQIISDPRTSTFVDQSNNNRLHGQNNTTISSPSTTYDPRASSRSRRRNQQLISN